MFSQLLRIRSVVLMGAALVVSPAFADVVFTDNTFNLADYSKTSTFLSNPSLVTLTVSSSPGTLTSVGTFLNNNGVNTTGLVGLFNTGFVINPATQGTITSIDASTVLNTILSTNSTGYPVNEGTGWAPAVEQDGLVYFACCIDGPTLTTVPGSTGPVTDSRTGLTAGNFDLLNFTTGATDSSMHPNFAGDPLTFGLVPGYTEALFLSGTTNFVDTSAYQDLSFDVHGATAVPEPATLALLGVGLAGLGFARRRKLLN